MVNVEKLNRLINEEIVKKIEVAADWESSWASPDTKVINLETSEQIVRHSIIDKVICKYKDKFNDLFSNLIDERLFTLLHEFSHLLTIEANDDSAWDKYQEELAVVGKDYRDISFEALADHLALQLLKDNYNYLTDYTDSISEADVNRNRETVRVLKSQYLSD